MFKTKKSSKSTTHKVEQSTNVVTFHRVLNKKKIATIVLVAVLLLVLAGIGVYYWYTKKQEAKIANTPVCDQSFLQRAGPLLDSKEREKLKPLVGEIQQKKNYEKDANCLYIIVTYYVNIIDGKNARSNFDKLKLVYDPNKRFDLAVGSHGGIEDLQMKVEYAEARENTKVKPRYAPSH